MTAQHRYRVEYTCPRGGSGVAEIVTNRPLTDSAGDRLAVGELVIEQSNLYCPLVTSIVLVEVAR